MNKHLKNLILYFAQGFGIGRIPFAPGTWGSVVGVFAFAFLIRLGPVAYFTVLIASPFISVLVCGSAARILGEEDPSSVVLDEIVAMPMCFLGWVILLLNQPWKPLPPGSVLPAVHLGPYPIGMHVDPIQRLASWPATMDFWLFVLIGFGLFRLFDIWKPWPIRQSQRLPGGWGIVMDDVLAAVYVNLVMLAGSWWLFA